jgi:hypothetical protein
MAEAVLRAKVSFFDTNPLGKLHSTVSFPNDGVVM